MKRTVIAVLTAFCLMLSGCSSFMDGEYVWVTSHHVEGAPGSSQNVSARNYSQLHKALKQMVEAGAEQLTISVGQYDHDALEQDVKKAISQLISYHPIAAYAVERIVYDLGTSGGGAALGIQISYIHDKAEIRQIKRVNNNQQASEAIAAALISCETGIVLQIENYQQADFVQIVETYAMDRPEYVMELPKVTVNVYPDSGKTRVVELKFSYQTSREALKKMQNQVQPFFSSAALYISGDAADSEKYAHLYSFLMVRYDYSFQSSITPAYSLIRHGVGDSKAFASVYAAMCRRAGLECQVVSGTRAGEPWYWNIIRDGEVHYHVDLLRSYQDGEFRELNDEDMTDYVWDFSAYPRCGKNAAE